MHRNVTLEIATPEAMLELGRALGKELSPGDFFGLVGDLGAGKTVLARGICEGAGVDPRIVSSPSFAIVATYPGRLPLRHADFYRLSDEEELYATGFYDLVDGESATLVEWIDQIPEAAPAERVLVHILGSGEEARTVELAFEGARYEGRFERVAPRP